MLATEDLIPTSLRREARCWRLEWRRNEGVVPEDLTCQIADYRGAEISRLKANRINRMERGPKNLLCQAQWNQGDGQRPPGGGAGRRKWLQRKEIRREIFAEMRQVAARKADDRRDFYGTTDEHRWTQIENQGRLPQRRRGGAERNGAGSYGRGPGPRRWRCVGGICWRICISPRSSPRSRSCRGPRKPGWARRRSRSCGEA